MAVRDDRVQQTDGKSDGSTDAVSRESVPVKNLTQWKNKARSHWVSRLGEQFYASEFSIRITRTSIIIGLGIESTNQWGLFGQRSSASLKLLFVQTKNRTGQTAFSIAIKQLYKSTCLLGPSVRPLFALSLFVLIGATYVRVSGLVSGLVPDLVLTTRKSKSRATYEHSLLYTQTDWHSGARSGEKSCWLGKLVSRDEGK